MSTWSGTSNKRSSMLEKLSPSVFPASLASSPFESADSHPCHYLDKPALISGKKNYYRANRTAANKFTGSTASSFTWNLLPCIYQCWIGWINLEKKNHLMTFAMHLMDCNTIQNFVSWLTSTPFLFPYWKTIKATFIRKGLEQILRY